MADVVIVLRPNRRTEAVGLALTHQIAPAVTAAVAHLTRELAAFDGWAQRGESAGRGTSSHTIPEAMVLYRDPISRDVEDIYDAIWGLEIAAKHLAKLCGTALGRELPAAIDVARCRDGQWGKDADRWSDDRKCAALPDKGQLCQRHYSAWRRHRESQGIDTTRDYEPAAACG